MANLLTLNQATGTDTLSNTTGFGYNAECTIASTTAQAYSGTRSLQITCTSSVGTNSSTWVPDYAYESNIIWMPVTGSNTYTAVCQARRAVGSTATTMVLFIYWWQANRTAASTAFSFVDITCSTSAWTQGVRTVAAPADAVYATLRLSVQDPAQNDVFYADELGLWEGSSSTWESPATTGVNLLTANQQTGGSWLGNTTGFGTATPATVTPVYATDQYRSSPGSIKAVCNGAAAYQGARVVIPGGTMSAGTYTFGLWFRVSSSSTAYTFGVVNDWDGTWHASSATRTADTWLYAEHTQTVSASAAGQPTYLSLATTDTAASTIWLDDASLEVHTAPAETPVTYGRFITIGG